MIQKITDVDVLQSRIEVGSRADFPEPSLEQRSLEEYVKLNGGVWLVTVAAFSDFALCGPPISKDLLTSCLLVDKKHSIIFLVQKLG